MYKKSFLVFFKKWQVIAILALGLALIAAVPLLAFLNRETSNAHAAFAGDWSSYMYDAQHSGFNAAETVINKTSASSLSVKWTAQGGGAIFSQPVVANGMVYWGSFDGYEHATNLNGQQVWQQNLGQVTQCAPGPGPLGIVGTAAVASVPINGQSTSVTFIGGGNGHLYALNAMTGAILWSTSLVAQGTNGFLWDSPLVVNNTVYIGTATTGEGVGCPLIAGQLFALDASAGTILHTFNDVGPGCGGGGIWSSPIYDPLDASIYHTSGTQGKCVGHQIDLVKEHASDLTFVSGWQIPVAQRLTNDADFGATPTLFTANIGGIVRNLVGGVDKNGVYYAFDRANLTTGPVWQATIAIPGVCPQCGQGSISSSAWDATSKALYVAGGKTTINGAACQGSLRALNPATGAVLWADCLKTGTVLGSVTAVPGVVAVVAGAALVLADSTTGAILYTNAAAHYYGSPSISNGVVYVGSTTGTLTALSVPGVVPPTPIIPPPTHGGPVSKTWYFAEGRVGGGFREYLTLGNSDPTNACAVKVQYVLQSGHTFARAVTVRKSSRLTLSVNTELNIQPAQPGVSVSAVVSVNTVATPLCAGVVVERPLYFSYQGINSGTDALGATHTGTTFYFADLGKGAGLTSYLTILNPPGGQTATVTATYYAGGAQVGTQQVTVAGGTRGTLAPAALGTLPVHTAVVVTSTQPVVVERPTYFAGINAGQAGTVSGAFTVLGSQTLASDWLFAEGYTGGSTQENLLISNVDTQANTPAAVTIHLDYADGTQHTFQVTVAPKSQLNWNVNQNGVGGTTKEVSAEVTSTGAKIIVEREMFFHYSHILPSNTISAAGGTDAIGEVGPASHSAYSFAEGYTNTGYHEWLTVQNPTATTETILVTLANSVGHTYTLSMQVGSHSRSTTDITAVVKAHLAVPGNSPAPYEITMTVQTSTAGAFFVAERAIYFNAGGIQGGDDVIGYSGG